MVRASHYPVGNPEPSEAPACVPRAVHSHVPVSASRRLPTLAALLVMAALACASFARASGPVIWDEDGDGIDDRIGTVQALGFRFSFENADTLARQRFEVTRLGLDLIFGVYVRYDHVPTSADLIAISPMVINVQHRLLAVPALRVRATAVQIPLIRQLPGVIRIEVVPIQYGATHDGAAALGVRDASGRVAPNVDGVFPTADGHGMVVGILDTGVNDAASGGWPGHEALIGRCLGGASFTAGDSALDTPKSGSINPDDPSVGSLAGHGTHIASIVLGSGGASGLTRGIAPAAKFVDVRVLGGVGAGTGIPEALDWCIANRTRNWGDPDTTYRGIDVINLSLSSVDASDGHDLASELCTAAVQAGIVVIASMGNDGINGHVPSPAAGDGVISVGSFDDQRSGLPFDDLAVSTDNQGPRADDGDGDPLDELSPTVLAPGIAVLAANGDLSTDGTRYVRRSGTSMAAAFVTGAVAALRSYSPTLSPGAIAGTLIATARRNGPGVPAGPTGIDPRWAASRGFGVVDLYAALLERTETAHTQVRRLMVSSTASQLTAEAWTMRERGTAHIVFERAPDVGGVPGTFAAVDSVPAGGDPNLTDGLDTQMYTRTWNVPPGEYGSQWWYRVAFTEGGTRQVSPATHVDEPTGPSAATIYATIVHDAYDHDLEVTLSAANGAYTQLFPGSSTAIAIDYVDGISLLGTIARTFRVEVPEGAASAFLPPSAAARWSLAITDAGFLNRSGRLTEYRLVWHSPGGDLTYLWGPGVLPTLEGNTVAASIPAVTTGVGEPGRLLPVSPNPSRPGALLTFARPTGARGPFEVFDLAGRRVAHVVSPGGAALGWRAVDSAGNPLAPGVYLARFGGGIPIRFVIVGR